MGDMSREPSMEEILSSIRRVIARDDPSQKGDLGRRLSPVGAEGLPEDEEDDVLELTDAEPEYLTDDGGQGAEADEATPMTSDTIAMSAEPSTVGGETVETATPELVSAVSAAASRHSLETLAAVLATGKEVVEPAPAVASGDLSVNALAEAALRPMLKQWLDANLPQMVERLVAREIARITGSRL